MQAAIRLEDFCRRAAIVIAVILALILMVLAQGCGSSSDQTDSPVIFGHHEPPFQTVGTPSDFVVTSSTQPIKSVRWNVEATPLGTRIDAQTDGLHASVTPLDAGCFTVSAVVTLDDDSQVKTPLSTSCVSP